MKKDIEKFIPEPEVLPLPTVEVFGTTYHGETPSSLIGIIEEVRQGGLRVRMHYGNLKTGKLWGDVLIGTIGRSMGPKRIPILLANATSSGGEGILDHCILLVESASKGKHGRCVYWKSPLLETSNECDKCGELRTNVLKCRCERRGIRQSA